MTLLSRSLTIAVVPLMVLAVFAGSASADDDPAEQALARGIALRRERRDAEALVEFRTAYAAKPTPRALAQIALAEAAVSDWLAADRDLTAALSASDAWIETKRDTLHVAFDEVERHIAMVDVTGPPHVEIWVAGALVGLLPVTPFRVETKPVVVELRAPGFITETRELHPLGGMFLHEAFTLRPVIVAEHPTPLEGAHEGLAVPMLPLQPLPEAHVVRSPTASPQLPLAWGTAGAAVLFLAGGIASFEYGAYNVGQYNNDALCDVPSRGTRSQQCASYASAYNKARVLEITSMALAGASGASSAILFLTLTGRTGSSDEASCRVTVGAVACALAF